MECCQPHDVMQEKSPTLPKIATLRMRLRNTSRYAVQTLFRYVDWMDMKLKFNDGYQQHPEMSQHQELKRVYQAAKSWLRADISTTSSAATSSSMLQQLLSSWRLYRHCER